MKVGSAVLETGVRPGVSRVAGAGLMSLILLSLGHAFVDLYSSALAALHPLLVDRFGLTLTQAGLLGGILVFSSSVMQPVYGYLSDRFPTRLFAALGPAVAGIAISCLGLAPGYGWLVALVWLGGVGIAMFHPQASARAAVAISERRGLAMAFFVSAGSLGYALGPTYFSAVLGRVGLPGSWWAAAPGLTVSLFLLAFLPGPAATVPNRRGRDWSALRSVWKPISILYALVFIRSVVQVTFAQFLPLYLHRERGMEVSHASHILSIYLLAGAIGGFAGGHLADRYGGRNIIRISMIGSVPFLALFFLVQGPLSFAGLFLGGLILLFTIPVNVVMGQELVPQQAGTVSALLMGFGWGMAGLVFIPVTGWLSDHITMHYALFSLVAWPVIGFFLALRLPK